MDGLTRRRLLGMAAAGAAGMTGTLAGCSTSPATPDRPVLRVGMLVPRTGPDKNIGADLENGLRLYLKTTGGRLSGYQIAIVPADEGDSLESGEKALKNLLDLDVVAVVGVVNPDLLPRVARLVEQKQVPLLAVHAAPVSMTSAFYIWRMAFLINEPALAISRHLKRRSVGRVGLVSVQTPANIEALDSFAKDYGSNALEPVFVKPNDKPQQADLTSSALKLINTGAKAIYCQLPAPYVGPLLQALRVSGWNHDEIYATGLAAEGAALEQLGTHATGLMTAMFYSADLNNMANHAFSALHMSEFQTSPSAFTVASYDAGALLDRAIGLCGDNPVTPQRVNQMISYVGQIVSPRGSWQFNQSRSPQQKWYLRRVGMDGPVLSNLLVSDLATLG